MAARGAAEEEGEGVGAAAAGIRCLSRRVAVGRKDRCDFVGARAAARCWSVVTFVVVVVVIAVVVAVSLLSLLRQP